LGVRGLAGRSKLKNEKLVGYILLAIGVVVLLFSIVQMMIVYDGSSSPPKLFNFSDITLPASSGGNVTLVAGSQLSLLFNLFFWYILMLFVMFVGGRIASLGVNMIKEVKVEVKQPLLTPGEVGKTETG
jgi:hypothetical protein